MASAETEPVAGPWDGLFGNGVRVAAVAITDRSEFLLPVERAGLPQASAGRLAEYSSGRWLARQLLESLGAGRPPIARGADRLPCWPIGWVGSISHSGTICAVAVARTSDHRGLGIDIEPDEPVKPGLPAMVCFGDELAWIADSDPIVERRRARLVFSVKEAVYKAFYPEVRRVWGFAEVAVEIEPALGVFRARLPADAGGGIVRGRVAVAEGWIAAGLSRPPG